MKKYAVYSKAQKAEISSHTSINISAELMACMEGLEHKTYYMYNIVWGVERTTSHGGECQHVCQISQAHISAHFRCGQLNNKEYFKNEEEMRTSR
jgi:hypothetical protein